MAYIITEPCIGTKDSACVDVYPDECIDCGACVPACPVEAIFALDEVPDKWNNYIEINAKHYQK
jgi:ferredoxin